MVAICPIVWQSKLQSETALSTMEAEIVALAHSCCKLFPIMDGVSIMSKAIGIPVGNTTIQVSIHQNNAGALVLAKTLLPQFTSQSKHFHYPLTTSIHFSSIIIQKRFVFERRL